MRRPWLYDFSAVKPHIDRLFWGSKLARIVVTHPGTMFLLAQQKKNPFPALRYTEEPYRAPIYRLNL